MAVPVVRVGQQDGCRLHLKAVWEINFPYKENLRSQLFLITETSAQCKCYKEVHGAPDRKENECGTRRAIEILLWGP